MRSARADLLAHARRRNTFAEGLTPNHLWCTDYNGGFMLAIKRYCYPLTVTDHASRYLLLCEAMDSNQEKACLDRL
jgi:putative transposase